MARAIARLALTLAVLAAAANAANAEPVPGEGSCEAAGDGSGSCGAGGASEEKQCGCGEEAMKRPAGGSGSSVTGAAAAAAAAARGDSPSLETGARAALDAVLVTLPGGEFLMGSDERDVVYPEVGLCAHQDSPQALRANGPRHFPLLIRAPGRCGEEVRGRDV